MLAGSPSHTVAEDSACLQMLVWESSGHDTAVMRGHYKYKTYKYDKWLKKNKFIHCGDMILQSCGLTRSKKALSKKPADIIGFVNQFQVMDWSTRTHKYTHTREMLKGYL